MQKKNLEIDTILFDLDGTLVDSILDIKLALNYMLAIFKLPTLSTNTLKGIIGRGLPTTVMETLNLYIKDKERVNKIHKKALELTLQSYNNIHGEQTKVYPSVIKTLHNLKEHGYKMAIVTNKEVNEAKSLLKKLQMLHFFPVVIGGNSTKHYKPHQAPIEEAISQLKSSKQKSIMIGDSITDINAANNAGIPSICVSYGYHANKINITKTIDNIKELEHLLDINNYE
jgi:phosphoglycolate phosphatase